MIMIGYNCHYSGASWAHMPVFRRAVLTYIIVPLEQCRNVYLLQATTLYEISMKSQWLLYNNQKGTHFILFRAKRRYPQLVRKRKRA